MTKPIIVDSHCHLDFPDFEGEIPDLIMRAQEAGVKRMVTICTRLKNEPLVRKISEKYEPVYYAAGTHPMSAAEEPLASVDQLIKISKHPKMVGIGETGLDYHYTADSAEIQKKSLIIHIEAARETGLPLIIHSRAADDDMGKILKSEFKKTIFTKMAGLSSAKVLNSFKKVVDPRRYNGASLLGLKGIIIKSHGGADSFAFNNSLQIALKEVKKDVPKCIDTKLREILG